MTDPKKEQLEKQKMNLVGIYNKIQEQIDSYGLQDLAYSSGPLKDLIKKRENIRRQIDLINKQLECLE